MKRIDKKLKYIVKKTRWPWVKLKIILKKQLGWLGCPRIYPYMGYSNGKEVYLSGSVIEDRGLSKPHVNQSKISNILSMMKRYVGDEFAGLKLRIEYEGNVKEVETNEEGFFSCQFKIEKPTSKEILWTSASYLLLDKIMADQPEVSTTGDVLMISQNPEFIIVSDVDDTFLVSHSTQFVKKIRLMLFKNAMTRLPFPGVAAFYKALQKGLDERIFNPIFYVSSSERNLYDLLVDFCEFRGIPKGPFLLRNFQTSLLKLLKAGGGNHLHKLESIKALLNFFPDIPFVLIGDSSQRDPEIYMQAVSEFPGRIKIIYIRAVGSKQKIEKTKNIADEVAKSGVEMLLVKNTEEASKHAIAKGLFNQSYFEQIHKEKLKDTFPE
ncbi:MAG: DUF2183 domain-containing protein [Bacteroidetes bacterium]|nr:DUF2183 domain-containing protein [Bacteroidota bacterium]